MRGSLYPNENADATASSEASDTRLSTGVVDNIIEGGLYRVHLSDESHVVCDIMMSVNGDDYVPTVGDPVHILERVGEIPAIVGTAITEDSDKRAFSQGERVIGHPSSDTHIRYTNDGNLLINVYDSDGTLTLQWEHGTNGETTLYTSVGGSAVLTFDSNGMHFADKQVMTDVNTTKDGDGDVQSVDPVYTQTISL